MMQLEEKVEILARDFGLEVVMEQNDLEDEQVIMILVSAGLINLEDYFYTDTDQLILNFEE